MRAGIGRHLPLVIVLLTGAVLRIWLSLDWRPAFLGFPDSAGFLHASNEGLTAANLRPPGYPLVLVGLRALGASIATTVGLQHVAGLASAGLLYAAALRFELPRAAALAGAATAALQGTLIALEHAVLAESLMLLAICAGLFATASAVAAGDARTLAAWSAAAGLAFGASATARTVGVALIGLAAACLVWALPGARRKLVGAGCLLALAALPVGANLIAVHHRSGVYSFAPNDAYQRYARVASFADCRAFKAPAGHEYLCPPGDARERLGPAFWLYDPQSPLLAALPPPGDTLASPEQLHALSRFARAAILGQPKAYLRTVARDALRVVDPAFPLSPNPAVGNLGAGYQPDALIAQLRNREGEALAAAYDDEAERLRYRRGTSFDAWERRTRLHGAPMVFALLLALASPLLVGRRRRPAVVLLAGGALALIFVPVLTLSENWRYVAPALPLLWTAAVAGAVSAARARSWRPSARRSAPR